MENKNTSFFVQVAHSISNINFYKITARQKARKALVYLLLLSFIMGAVAIIRPTYEFNRGISFITEAFEDEIPDFVLQDGELEVKGNMPIILGDQNYKVIIDTSGKTGEEILRNYDNALLVLKDKMIQKDMFTKNVTSFSSMQGITLTKDTFAGFIPLLRWISVLIVVFGIIGFIAVRFLTALIMGIIGLIINAIKGTNIKFEGLFNIGSYALTVPIILISLLRIGGIEVKFFWLIYFIIPTIYMWFAISAITKSMTAPVDVDNV